MINTTVLRGITADFRSFSKVQHENSIRIFLCKSGEKEYFQTDNWELGSTSG
jgi:hypothetical protein